MPRRPRPPNLASRACAALACLTAACNFDAQGLGESTDVVLSASSSSSGAPGTTTGPGSTSTGEPTPDSSGDASSTGEPACVEDCPPVPAWTVMAPAEPHALALDAAGDAVVVGDCPQASNAAISDVWTGKFAGLDGAQIWEARHNGGQHGRDFARVALQVERDRDEGGEDHRGERDGDDAEVAAQEALELRVHVGPFGG